MFMKNSVHFLFINVIPRLDAIFGKINWIMNLGISMTLAYFGSLQKEDDTSILNIDYNYLTSFMAFILKEFSGSL